MHYKLLAVDLDGTYLARDGHPHEVDRRALLALSRAGIQVTILTGRLYPGARAAADSFELQGPLGCADGAHMVLHDHRLSHAASGTHNAGKSLQLQQIGAQRGALLRTALASVQGCVYTLGERVICFDADGERFVPYMRDWSDELRAVPRVLDDGGFEAGALTAVVALGAREELQNAREQVDAACDAAQLPRLSSTLFPLSNSGAYGLVVRPEGASKGAALRWLCQHHGITPAQCVVVGDWLNDISMFQVAGLSLAMGSAPPEVRAHAHRVLDESSERGGAMARIAREVFGVSCT